MNKSISNIRSGLMAAVITTGLFLGAASATLAAGNELILTGEIEPIATIAVAGSGTYAAIDLTATPTTGTPLVVGATTEICNDVTGYTVHLASLNAVGTQAKLLGTDVNQAGTSTNAINYSIKYNDVTLELVNKACANAYTKTSMTAAGPTGDTHDIAIFFTGSAWNPADTYTDTLTLTISVN